MLACLDENIYALERVLRVTEYVSFLTPQIADTYTEPK